MFGAARSRAARQKVPFTITLDDLMLPANCPVLGLSLDFGAGQASDNSPTLDKVIPEMGYVKGNVLIVSMRANRIKNDATVEELKMVSKFYSRWIKENWMKE